MATITTCKHVLVVGGWTYVCVLLECNSEIVMRLSKRLMMANKLIGPVSLMA